MGRGGTVDRWCDAIAHHFWREINLESCPQYQHQYHYLVLIFVWYRCKCFTKRCTLQSTRAGDEGTRWWIILWWQWLQNFVFVFKRMQDEEGAMHSREGIGWREDSDSCDSRVASPNPIFGFQGSNLTWVTLVRWQCRARKPLPSFLASNKTV